MEWPRNPNHAFSSLHSDLPPALGLPFTRPFHWIVSGLLDAAAQSHVEECGIADLAVSK